MERTPPKSNDPKKARKLTSEEKAVLSPIQKARIEMGGKWIWLEDSPYA
jgi:hypothetical protein